MKFIESASNVCRVTLDIPWEVAEALSRHWPSIIGAIQQALNQREDDARRSQLEKARLDEECDRNVVLWRSLAQDLWDEVHRRSNGRGQRAAIVKQLAAERGLQVSFCNQIMGAFPDAHCRQVSN